MASLQKSARNILSDIEMYLREKVTPAKTLIAMGWRDFRLADRPDAADAVAMACEAFVYLSINSDGNWNGAINVLTAIKAYLDGQTGREASEEDVRRLAVLLRKRPVSVQEVREWFDDVYG